MHNAKLQLVKNAAMRIVLRKRKVTDSNKALNWLIVEQGIDHEGPSSCFQVPECYGPCPSGQSSCSEVFFLFRSILLVQI